MHTLAIGNLKGGVSKTTLTFNLGHDLADRGYRVLLVDADYQADLTAMCGVTESPAHNMTQVMTGALSVNKVMVATTPVRGVADVRDHLHIIPSDIELANVDALLSHKIGRENLLKRALSNVAASYDVAIIDCPPSLGLMTVNALSAAGAVIIPLQPSSVDLRALSTFMATITDIRNQINPVLTTLGVVLTFYDPRFGLHADAVAAIEGAGLPILARIGRSVHIAEASGAHLPLSKYDAGNPQVTAFQTLSKAVIKWLDQNERS